MSPQNGVTLQKLAAAGIPIRVRSVGASMHWKFMLFFGQQTLEFGAANFSTEYFIPVQAYRNYTDEAIYFTDDPPIVDSFKTRMDDAWMDTALFSNYANVRTPLARENGTFPISPDLLFVPWQNFATRAVPRYDAETSRIDVIMYKITEASHADGHDPRRQTRRPGAPHRRTVVLSRQDATCGRRTRSIASTRPACRFESARIRASRTRRPSCYTGRR